VRFPLSLVAAMPAMRYQERSKKASALDSGMAPLRRGLLFWRIRRPPRCRHTRGSRGRPNRREPPGALRRSQRRYPATDPISSRDESGRERHLALKNRLVAGGIAREGRSWEKTSDHAPAWVELEDIAPIRFRKKARG